MPIQNCLNSKPADVAWVDPPHTPRLAHATLHAYWCSPLLLLAVKQALPADDDNLLVPQAAGREHPLHTHTCKQSGAFGSTVLLLGTTVNRIGTQVKRRKHYW